MNREKNYGASNVNYLACVVLSAGDGLRTLVPSVRDGWVPATTVGQMDGAGFLSGGHGARYVVGRGRDT